jgi:hypothetical protein
MIANRDQPPENENAFFVNITAAYQTLKNWRLERSLAKIKNYENTLLEAYCNGCFNGPIENCKYREERQLSGCKFWQDKICDYRAG